jgi:hypothetical protein
MTYSEHVLGEALGLPVPAPGELLGTHDVLPGLDGGLPRLPVLHPQAAQRTQVQLLLHLQDLIPAHQRRGSGRGCHSFRIHPITTTRWIKFFFYTYVRIQIRIQLSSWIRIRTQRTCSNVQRKAVLRIHEILVWIWIRIRGSMKFWCGSGSGDPCL